LYTVCVSNLGADTHIQHSAYLCASDRHLYTNKYTHIYKYAHIQVNVPKWCAGVCVYVLAYIHIWHPSVHPPPKKKFHHYHAHARSITHTTHHRRARGTRDAGLPENRRKKHRHHQSGARADKCATSQRQNCSAAAPQVSSISRLLRCMTLVVDARSQGHQEHAGMQTLTACDRPRRV